MIMSRISLALLSSTALWPGLAAAADAPAPVAAVADADQGLSDIVVTAEKTPRKPPEDADLDLGAEGRRSG
jgi:hypothetical protein